MAMHSCPGSHISKTICYLQLKSKQVKHIYYSSTGEVQASTEIEEDKVVEPISDLSS